MQDKTEVMNKFMEFMVKAAKARQDKAAKKFSMDYVEIDTIDTGKAKFNKTTNLVEKIFVPVYRRVRFSKSRYTGDKLRAIRQRQVEAAISRHKGMGGDIDESRVIDSKTWGMTGAADGKH